MKNVSRNIKDKIQSDCFSGIFVDFVSLPKMLELMIGQ